MSTRPVQCSLFNSGFSVRPVNSTTRHSTHSPREVQHFLALPPTQRMLIYLESRTITIMIIFIVIVLLLLLLLVLIIIIIIITIIIVTVVVVPFIFNNPTNATTLSLLKPMDLETRSVGYSHHIHPVPSVTKIANLEEW